MKAVLFVLVSVMFAGYANAQTAEIKVAERDCSKTTLSKLFYANLAGLPNPLRTHAQTQMTVNALNLIFSHG